MARTRTKDDILDQLVFAVAAVARHYGPELNAEGLADVRRRLAGVTNWHCDSSWRCNDDEDDFCPWFIRAEDVGLDFETVVRKSRTGAES